MTGITDLEIEDNMEEMTEEEEIKEFRVSQENSLKLSSFCEESGMSIREILLAITYLFASLSSFLSKDDKEMEDLYRYIGEIKKIHDIAKSQRDQAKKDNSKDH